MLLATLTLQSFYRSIMTLDYQIHLPEYLAKCINKERPQLHCNGQCILMKKIKEKEKQETKKNLVVYEYSALYLHNNYIIFQKPAQTEETQILPVSAYLTNYAFSYRSAVFRPPIS